MTTLNPIPMTSKHQKQMTNNNDNICSDEIKIIALYISNRRKLF